MWSYSSQGTFGSRWYLITLGVLLFGYKLYRKSKSEICKYLCLYNSLGKSNMPKFDKRVWMPEPIAKEGLLLPTEDFVFVSKESFYQ
jgi:hypothetical protein